MLFNKNILPIRIALCWSVFIRLILYHASGKLFFRIINTSPITSTTIVMLEMHNYVWAWLTHLTSTSEKLSGKVRLFCRASAVMADTIASYAKEPLIVGMFPRNRKFWGTLSRG